MFCFSQYLGWLVSLLILMRYNHQLVINHWVQREVMVSAGSPRGPPLRKAFHWRRICCRKSSGVDPVPCSNLATCGTKWLAEHVGDILLR